MNVYELKNLEDILEHPQVEVVMYGFEYVIAKVTYPDSESEYIRYQFDMESGECWGITQSNLLSFLTG